MIKSTSDPGEINTANKECPDCLKKDCTCDPDAESDHHESFEDDGAYAEEISE